MFIYDTRSAGYVRQLAFAEAFLVTKRNASYIAEDGYSMLVQAVKELFNAEPFVTDSE